MTRTEILLRLRTIRDKAIQALNLFESRHSSPIGQRRVAQRINPYVAERAQKTMSVFELCIYSPTIEKPCKKSGISRLKIDGALDHKWQEPLEVVVYNFRKALP